MTVLPQRNGLSPNIFGRVGSHPCRDGDALGSSSTWMCPIYRFIAVIFHCSMGISRQRPTSSEIQVEDRKPYRGLSWHRASRYETDRRHQGLHSTRAGDLTQDAFLLSVLPSKSG